MPAVPAQSTVRAATTSSPLLRSFGGKGALAATLVAGLRRDPRLDELERHAGVACVTLEFVATRRRHAAGDAQEPLARVAAGAARLVDAALALVEDANSPRTQPYASLTHKAVPCRDAADALALAFGSFRGLLMPLASVQPLLLGPGDRDLYQQILQHLVGRWSVLADAELKGGVVIGTQSYTLLEAATRQAPDLFAALGGTVVPAAGGAPRAGAGG